MVMKMKTTKYKNAKQTDAIMKELSENDKAIIIYSDDNDRPVYIEGVRELEPKTDTRIFGNVEQKRACISLLPSKVRYCGWTGFINESEHQPTYQMFYEGDSLIFGSDLESHYQQLCAEWKKKLKDGVIQHERI